MNHKKRYNIGILFIVSFFIGQMSNMSARSISSINSFYRAVERAKFSVVMMYRSEKLLKKNDRALYDQIEKVRSAFNTLSSVRVYKNADVLFVQANVAINALEELPGNFGVTVQQEPMFILLVDGKPLKSSKSNMQGFLNVDQLRSFIDDNLHDRIEDYLDDKAERRREEESRAAVSFGIGYPWYGYYPYYGGFGYPYYGGGFGYGGRVGFGVGFGF